MSDEKRFFPCSRAVGKSTALVNELREELPVVTDFASFLKYLQEKALSSLQVPEEFIFKPKYPPTMLKIDLLGEDKP